jgi:hypothetical protein
VPARAPALSPTVSVRDQLFDHIHATMVSTRAGAGKSVIDAVGWLALWFEERVRRNGSRCKKTTIVALARKLLVAEVCDAGVCHASDRSLTSSEVAARAESPASRQGNRPMNRGLEWSHRHDCVDNSRNLRVRTPGSRISARDLRLIVQNHIQ